MVTQRHRCAGSSPTTKSGARRMQQTDGKDLAPKGATPPRRKRGRKDPGLYRRCGAASRNAPRPRCL